MVCIEESAWPPKNVVFSVHIGNEKKELEACTQIVPSSLSNATSNHLVPTAPMKAAIETPGIAIACTNSPSQNRNANSNLDVHFTVVDFDPFPPYFGRQKVLPTFFSLLFWIIEGNPIDGL